MAFSLSSLGKIGSAWRNITYSVVSANDPSDILMEFDVIDECNMTGSATATQYPVEEGYNITDYKYANPDVVQMRGVLTAGGILGIGTAIEGLINMQTKQSMIERTRNKLRELKNNIILVNINTRNGGLWESLTLLNYEINETPDNFSLFEVDMQFQQVMVRKVLTGNTRNPADSNTQAVGITQTFGL